MIKFIARLFKWALALILLLLVSLASPIAYVEMACRAPAENQTYAPLIQDAAYRRPEANTYLTYPEWHIVYAYDGLAEILKTSDEYRFGYVRAVQSFWTSTCELMQLADRHGGADRGTRVMIHTIGASFTLEMALKAAYEETVGRLAAWYRGDQKTPQDLVARDMAADYAAFLRQTPWYKYDFGTWTARLWAAPVAQAARGWERRLALGTEWTGKSLYAGLIGAGVAATGEADLAIRSVVEGMDVGELKAIEGVTVVSEENGVTIIETPRYAAFTRVLAEIVAKGGTIREIAGNDDIMVSILVPYGALYQGPGEEILRLRREGLNGERLLVGMKVPELTQAFRTMQIADPGIEHVFDY